MYIRYDELKEGDLVLFHGANLKIKKITKRPAPANEWYPKEASIAFQVEPADDEAVEILGNFYSRGTYGGVGCLRIKLIKRAEGIV